MKKLSVILTAIILSAFFSGNLSAQDFSLGAGVNYATGLNGVGISINGNYAINKNIQIAPVFIHYFENDGLTWNVLDVDGHYKFVVDSAIDVYGIAGLGITFTSFTIDFGPYLGGEQSTSDSNFGFNLGLGASKNLGSVDIFAEAKYTINSDGYLKIGVGVLYRF